MDDSDLPRRGLARSASEKPSSKRELYNPEVFNPIARKGSTNNLSRPAARKTLSRMVSSRIMSSIIDDKNSNASPTRTMTKSPTQNHMNFSNVNNTSKLSGLARSPSQGQKGNTLESSARRSSHTRTVISIPVISLEGLEENKKETKTTNIMVAINPFVPTEKELKELISKSLNKDIYLIDQIDCTLKDSQVVKITSDTSVKDCLTTGIEKITVSWIPTKEDLLSNATPKVMTKSKSISSKEVESSSDEEESSARSVEEEFEFEQRQRQKNQEKILKHLDIPDDVEGSSSSDEAANKSEDEEGTASVDSEEEDDEQEESSADLEAHLTTINDVETLRSMLNSQKKKYEKSRKRLTAAKYTASEARSTMASLIRKIGSYKSVLEEDRDRFKEELSNLEAIHQKLTNQNNALRSQRNLIEKRKR